MDARRLKLLAAVLEHGSFTRAAAALNLTQPSLSRQVAALERQAGVRLLDRVPNGVRATAAGLALARRGQAIDAHLKAADRELAQLRGLRAGRLRLAAFPSAAATLALDLLIALRDAHPGLSVTLEEHDRENALRALRTGTADIAITFTEADEPSDDLFDTTPLFEEPMLLALPADDPRVADAPCFLSAFASDPWIIGTRGDPGLIARACLRAGFAPRVAARLDNQPAIQAAVVAGVGTTLIPALAAQELRPGITAVELAPPTPSRRIHAHRLAGPADDVTATGLHALARVALTRGRGLA
jgi:DNA-binding transcriptional LysR family regulator